jgi:Ca2+-binding EF-hand superfamily protein
METNAERRERLLTVFKSIAKNPNNDNATHFSRAELKSTISTKLQRSTTRHTNTVFEKMHTSMDTDDTITFEEFYVFCMSREKKLRKVFVQYDISKTNKITKSDMKYALRNLTNHRVSQSQINSYMKFFDNTYDDAHGDGISYEIFRDSLLLLNVDSLTDISDHYFADCNFNYTMWEPALAGGVAAAVSGTTVAPLERLRMTMITDGTKKYLSR